MTAPRVIVLDAPHTKRPCYRALVEAAPGPWYYRVDLGLGKAAVKGLNPEARACLAQGKPTLKELYDATSQAIEEAETKREFTLIRYN